MELLLVGGDEKLKEAARYLLNCSNLLDNLTCVGSISLKDSYLAGEALIVIAGDAVLEDVTVITRLKSGGNIVIALLGDKDVFSIKDYVNAGLDGILLQPVNRDDLKSLAEMLLEHFAQGQPENWKDMAQLVKVKTHIYTKFAYDLVYGNETSMKEILEMTDFLKIDKLPNCAMVVSIDNFAAITANQSQMRKTELRLKVLKTVEEAVRQLETGLVCTVSDDSFAVVFHLDYLDREQAVKDSVNLAGKVKELVEKLSFTSVSIGIGKRYRDIRNLNLSYQQACGALEHRFFKGGGQIIHVSEVEPFNEGVTLFSPIVKEELLSKVRFGDREGAEDIVDEMFSGALQDANLSPPIVQARCLELVVNLLRAAAEGGMDPAKIGWFSSRYARLLFDISTVQRLRGYMHRLVEKLTDEVSGSRNQRNLKMVHKAVEYINEHYHYDLSLEEVARSAGLSSYYFSHIFKKETGKTFIEFLTDVRIEQAKRLLSDSEFNVSEISRRVGYQDPKYFSRVFKNLVGVPPSKFS